jgi:hypothetical protein
MLAELTHKQDGLDLSERIYYTLSGKNAISRDNMQAHRNSKAIALLLKALVDAGTLTEEQLDEILLNVVT